MRYSQRSRRDNWRSKGKPNSEPNLKETVSQAAGTIKDLAGSAFGQLYNVAKGISLSDKALKVAAVTIIASSLLTAEANAEIIAHKYERNPNIETLQQEVNVIKQEQTQKNLSADKSNSNSLTRAEMLNSPLDPSVRKQYEDMRKFLVEYESAVSREYFDRLGAKVKSNILNSGSTIKENYNSIKETIRTWNDKAIDYTAATVQNIFHIKDEVLLKAVAQAKHENIKSDLNCHDNLVKMQRSIMALCSQYSRVMPIVQRKDADPNFAKQLEETYGNLKYHDLYKLDRQEAAMYLASGHTSEDYSKFAEGMVSSIMTTIDDFLRMPKDINFTKAFNEKLEESTPEERINIVDRYMQSFAKDTLKLIDEDRQKPLEEQYYSYVDLEQLKKLAEHGALIRNQLTQETEVQTFAYYYPEH